jgi:hypothetical protein
MEYKSSYRNWSFVNPVNAAASIVAIRFDGKLLHQINEQSDQDKNADIESKNSAIDDDAETNVYMGLIIKTTIALVMTTIMIKIKMMMTIKILRMTMIMTMKMFMMTLSTMMLTMIVIADRDKSDGSDDKDDDEDDDDSHRDNIDNCGDVDDNEDGSE